MPSELGYLNDLRGGRAYERGYLDALRRVRDRLSGSGAFNCGSYRGFEYPVELVEAMIQAQLRNMAKTGNSR